MSRKKLVILGAIAAIMMLAATARIATFLLSHEYKEPYRGTAAQAEMTPRAEGLADEHAAACPWIDDEIKFLKPPLILAVGKKAWARLVNPRDSITKVNATVSVVDGTKIVACLHPAFVMRDDTRRPDFEAAIEKFAGLCKILYPDDSPERRLPEEISMSVRARAILGKRP